MEMSTASTFKGGRLGKARRARRQAAARRGDGFSGRAARLAADADQCVVANSARACAWPRRQKRDALLLKARQSKAAKAARNARSLLVLRAIPSDHATPRTPHR